MLFTEVCQTEDRCINRRFCSSRWHLPVFSMIHLITAALDMAPSIAQLGLCFPLLQSLLSMFTGRTITHPISLHLVSVHSPFSIPSGRQPSLTSEGGQSPIRHAPYHTSKHCTNTVHSPAFTQLMFLWTSNEPASQSDADATVTLREKPESIDFIFYLQ